MPHLKELNTKYRDRGFELVAVSAEKSDKVEPFVKDKAIEYGVVLYSNIAKDYGLKGWPSAWVVDPEGKVLWAGNFIDRVTDAEWEAWLEQVTPGKVGREVAKELKPAAKAFDAGEVGKAQKLAEEAAAAATDDLVKADADFIQGLVEKHRVAHQGKIDKAGSDAVAKAKALDEAAAKFKGSELGTKWETEAKELKKSKEYKDCSASADELEKVRGKLEDMKPSNARKALEKIAKKYPETPAGKEAAELAKKYEE